MVVGGTLGLEYSGSDVVGDGVQVVFAGLGTCTWVVLGGSFWVWVQCWVTWAVPGFWRFNFWVFET